MEHLLTWKHAHLTRRHSLLYDWFPHTRAPRDAYLWLPVKPTSPRSQGVILPKRDGTEDDKEEYNEKVEEGSNKVSLRFSQLQTEHGLKTYLNRSSRPWKRKDRSIPQVCLPNASSMVSISVHAESANCALSASGMLLSVRLRMQLFHNNIARI